MKKIAIGIDLGGTSIKYAVVEEGGRIIWQSKRSSKADQPTRVIIQNIIDAAQEAKTEAHTAGFEPCCIGIGTPGLVDIHTGLIVGGADNLNGWENIPLAQEVQTATGLPTFVDNDANLMGLGEYAFGGIEAQQVVFFTIGTGIGGAIFDKGELYRGYNHAGNELGAVMMSYEGEDGYWEDFASTAAMVRQFKAKAAGSQHPSDVNGKYIFDQFMVGEPLAKAIMLEHTRLIGYGMAGFINIFNPEKIIIGGGISEAGAPYIELVDKAAKRYAMEACSKGVEILAAKMGNRAGFLGASHFALSMLAAKA